MVDKEQILSVFDTWFKTTDKIEIDDKGLVSTKGVVVLRKRPLGGPLPVRFGTVGAFYVDGSGLTSFENSPQKINGSAWYGGNPITSWSGAPKEVFGYFGIANTRLFDLSGLPLETTGIAINYKQDMPLLRALQSKKIDFASTNYSAPEIVSQILNRYAGQGRQGSLACAAELSRAGYKANARW
jgi:hypothetical protein